MRKLLSHLAAATLGLWLATIFIPQVTVKLFPNTNVFGVTINLQWQIFLLLGITLGLLNFFVKPILDVVGLPLRIITLGFFSFVINGAMIWIVDILFKEFSAPWIWPLAWVTIIVWALNILISAFVVPKPDTK